MVDDAKKIPLSLLTGFLGSGKTTLLNELIGQPAFHNTLVIINEFGEISLDHLLVTHSEEDLVVEMSSGCVCCSIRGDLQTTLHDVYDRFVNEQGRQFDRVVIETTGLASPIPILHTLMTDQFIASHYFLDSVITTIDAVNGVATLDNYQEAVQQAAVADHILITKSDLSNEAAVATLVDRLHQLNPSATHDVIMNGRIDGFKLLNTGLFTPTNKHPDVEAWLNAEAIEAHHRAHHHHHHEHDDHEHHHHEHEELHHDDHIRTFCFTLDEPVSDQVFEEWLSMFISFQGERILRMKGIINLKGESRPVVIHGVQHLFHPAIYLPKWPSEDHRTRLVFITKDIEKETVARSFNAILEAYQFEEPLV